MMDLGTIWFFIIPFALAAALPGPAQGALVAQVLRRRCKRPLSMWKCPLLRCRLRHRPWLSGLSWRPFIAVIGVAYLLFVAWKLWNAPSGTAAPEIPASGNRGILAERPSRSVTRRQ